MSVVSTVGLIGAGAIGRAHLNGAAQAAGIKIVGIADPNPAAAQLANEFGLPHFTDHRTLRDTLQPDGAIIATPNALHVPMALEWLAEGRPVLVEKPVAGTVEEGRQLAHAADAAKVPVLVGHHRRHNPILRKARELVREGALGRLVSASVLATFLKPDAYFEQAWRRSNGGGPVLINLIHEIDLVRFVCGEIRSLQALTSNAIREFEVEDSAAALLRLDNNALVTITLSDTAASPWSWDLASGENPAFSRSQAESHFLCGTNASLALPTLRTWRYPGERGWFQPLEPGSIAFQPADPYIEQMRHFGAVIRREEAPLTDALDATRTLEVTLAVRQAAQSGTMVYF
ncbi:Gfo/Idh/MocA family protein [Pseudorhodoferax sp.]|uniref:Gfo/Idh/MocA family protein n=1 Tax=Pseudorhodoferax sp. TaxID=1993553 RepID=UPI0039E2A795